MHYESVSIHVGRETDVLKDYCVENLRNSYEAVENNGGSVRDDVGGSVAIGSTAVADLDNEGIVENKEAFEQVRKLVQCISIIHSSLILLMWKKQKGIWNFINVVHL